MVMIIASRRENSRLPWPQAVALLIYHDFAKFVLPKKLLKFRDDVINTAQ